MIDVKSQIIELAVVIGTAIFVFRYLLKDLLHAMGDCFEEAIDLVDRIRIKWKAKGRAN
jgi:hypothetical protein